MDPKCKMAMIAVVVAVIAMAAATVLAEDTNNVFNPCADTKIQRSDGFTFGLASAARNSFFSNQTQLSPCDHRLALASSTSRIAVFRPKVDEISLLTINTTANFSPENYGGNMVAFAGRIYAARSTPTFVANNTYIITSTTLWQGLC